MVCRGRWLVSGGWPCPKSCASHAKPWAECANDAERLDVFNGFLLVANLNALFDRFLISFDDTGRLDGFQEATVKLALQLRQMGRSFREYLKGLVL